MKVRKGFAEDTVVAFLVIFAIVFVISLFWIVPSWRVWQQGMSGKAKLREAEWSRKILIEEAEAMKLSEIARAQGVAEANRIIGESLQGNQEYLTYLWLQHLGDQSSKVIYIPTEANLPMLEAGRLNTAE